MSEDPKTFIENIVSKLKPVYTAHTNAIWESATTGSKETAESEKDAQTKMMQFWADSQRYLTAKRLDEGQATIEPEESRQIKLIHLAAAKAQQDEATIEKLTELETRVRHAYYNYRAVIDGAQVSDNDLDNLLTKSDQSDVVQEAWEASKQIGEEVEDNVRELAKVRNDAAQAQGYRDHFHKSLLLNEINEEELMTLFAQLAQVSQSPFEALKSEIDRSRAAHFNIEVDELMPWHYGDRFFQTSPQLGEVSVDHYFEGKDPKELALLTYDGLGLEVRDILLRSDLYARPGKNQHAFCIDMDREGDVRTLNNLESNHRWTTTLLHELGHAIYDKYIDHQIPWLLRKPPHSLSTEAIAIMMGSLSSDRQWLAGVLQVPDEDADQLAMDSLKHERARGLVFTRWCLVMTNFERSLYGNPDGDLNNVWWDLVEQYQLLQKPDGRDKPDWASKYHIPLAPVYYQNYELGMLVSSQFRHFLEQDFGGIVGQNAVGEWLVNRAFRTGALEDWSKHVETVTGEPLNPDYFIQSVM
jgi:peptidyl-dipeptidase A